MPMKYPDPQKTNFVSLKTVILRSPFRIRTSCLTLCLKKLDTELITVRKQYIKDTFVLYVTITLTPSLNYMDLYFLYFFPDEYIFYFN